MQLQNQPSWFVFLVITLKKVIGADDDYNVIHRDGSYEFGYNNPDSYHYADANRNNIVKGEFGGRNPATGAIDSTVYTAGPRGFRPRGKNVVRKYDLNQNGPRPVGSRDDPYYDPYEDPSYSFSFRTRTYNRQENANRVGDVNGRYSYVDDVGERHNVEFVAGKNTGFHVKTPFPDSNPRAYGPLYFNGRGKPIPRGRTSIQRGLDGSYRFVSAGPDQRRTETSDSTGHVRGSYTYLDDKGVQHSVHYIAGPETGYRVLKHVKGPHLPTVFPFGRPEIIPPDFYDYSKDGDVFDTAASGHVKPIGGKPGAKEEAPSFDKGADENKDDFNFGMKKPVRPRPRPGKPSSSFGGATGGPFNKPSYQDEDTDDFGDLFGGGGGSGTGGGGGGGGGTGGGSDGTGAIGGPSGIGGTSGIGDTGGISGAGGFSTTSRPTLTSDRESSREDDGSYKPSVEDGAYKPSKPTPEYGIPSTPLPGQSDIGSMSSPQGPPRPISGGKPNRRPGGRPGARPGGRPGSVPSVSPVLGGGYGDGFGAEKPSPGFSEGPASHEERDDFGLFGSASSNARPPYGGRPVIQIGATDDSCQRCKGTIVTNVGDRLFTVPPGVSVRAHVQAIDLLPIIPTVPSPSEQYKADTSLRTEQLNEATNDIISTNYTESIEETTTDVTITTTLIPNTNSTNT